jgi:hypothetical protein
MGFFEGLGRMIKGEPVFQESDNPTASTHVGAPQEPHIEDSSSVLPSEPIQGAPIAPKPVEIADPYVKDGRKITPEVLCENVDWNENGENREIYVRFSNRGATAAFLDKVSLLGQTTELNYTLAPGGERDFRVYNGEKLKSRSYTKAQLYIRLPNGDYFCADLEVLYNVKGDGESEVKELRLIRPIRDV